MAPIIAALDQAMRRLAPTELVATLPASVRATAEALNRIRLGAVKGRQVFTPVLYGMYPLTVVC